MCSNRRENTTTTATKRSWAGKTAPGVKTTSGCGALLQHPAGTSGGGRADGDHWRHFVFDVGARPQALRGGVNTEAQRRQSLNSFKRAD